jgi:hypothetical protein
MAPSNVTVTYTQNGAPATSNGQAVVLDTQLAAVRAADIPGWNAWGSPQVRTGGGNPEIVDVDTTVVLTADTNVVFLRLVAPLSGVTTAEDYFRYVADRQEGLEVVEDLLAGKKVRHQTTKPTTGQSTKKTTGQSTKKETGGIFCIWFGIC